MLTNQEQNDLMEWLHNNTALPTRIQGELAAFRHGLAIAVSALASRVEMADKETKQIDSAKADEQNQ